MAEPPLGINISIIGMEDINKRLSDPTLLQRPVRKALYRMGLAVQGEAAKRAPVGVGGGAGLRGSISTTVDSAPLPRFVKVGPGVRYGAAVEFGSRPHMPPVSALIDWVRLKAARGSPNPERIAWAIAKTIARRGTRPHPYMAPGLQAARSKINSLAGGMVKAIAVAMGTGRG
jgi:hypothetical protein